MRLRLLLILFAIAILTVFVVVNWFAFIAPTALNLGFINFEAPLGLLMLGLAVTITLVFMVYMAIWQSKILAEARRQAKELQQQRALADQAEMSRITELGTDMHKEFEQLAERLNQSQIEFKKDLRDNVNSLAAMLGELDDRTRKHGIELPLKNSSD